MHLSCLESIWGALKVSNGLIEDASTDLSHTEAIWGAVKAPPMMVSEDASVYLSYPQGVWGQ